MDAKQKCFYLPLKWSGSEKLLSIQIVFFYQTPHKTPVPQFSLEYTFPIFFLHPERAFE